MYWNINEILPYQRLFNWIVGFRGAGKTFGCKEKFAGWYIKDNEQFVYMRRFEKEFKKNNLFWNDIISEQKYPENKLETNGKTYLIDNKIAGHGVVLSTAKIDKGVAAYPEVRNFLYDEFILDKGVHHYLPDEVTMLLEALNTIIRQKPNMRLFFCANAISVANPYFIKLGLQIPEPGKIWYNKFHLVQNVTFDSLRAGSELTEWEQFMQTIDYGKYAMQNEFLRDNNEFIEQKTQSICIFIIAYGGSQYGVWETRNRGMMFVSRDYDPSCRHIYSFSFDDHKPNTMLIKQASKIGNFKAFLEYFKAGYVRFEDVTIKNIMFEVIGKTI